jgi:hypothetical protein
MTLQGNSEVIKGDCDTPKGTRSKAVAKPEARSRVSNGKDLFLEGVDGRSALARRYRDILAQLTSDIGGDPSEAQNIIVRRATTLAVWCEQAEAKAAAGNELSIGEYATATNSLRRLLLDLGLERRMRDITPSIDAYLKR